MNSLLTCRLVLGGVGGSGPALRGLEADLEEGLVDSGPEEGLVLTRPGGDGGGCRADES